MNPYRLQCRTLTKRYRDVVALDGLDLVVHEGELLALVGPSGCGKTTALHIIAGLLEPDKGELLFDGSDWLTIPPGRRNVALVFQDGALYPHLTVAGNLEFPLKARGRRDPEAVRRIAARLEIASLLERYPHELSGGEGQRVALGRALIRRPNLLLLDEPLSNLDLPLREKLRGLVRDLVRETGVTSVFVTHDQAEAMAVGDRVAVMQHGRIVQIDGPRAIYDRPQHEFVARFFGSPAMNLLPGRIRNGSVAGEWGELTCPSGTEGMPVLCGFRPESTYVVAQPTGLNGALVRIEEQGPAKIAAVRVGGCEIRLRLHPDKTLPAIGETVHLVVEADHMHLFDAATGKRL